MKYINHIENLVNKCARRMGFSLFIGTPLPVRRLTIQKTAGFAALFSTVKDIEGDIVECGVGKGGSFSILAFFASKQNRVLWGFDSFDGFPTPTAEDTSERKPQRGEWRFLNVPMLVSVLRSVGFSQSWIEKNVRIVPGFFDQSLKQYSGKIALLNVDVDLYQSYKDVLAALYPSVVPGGIIVFDEYGMEAWPGATKAIDEFTQEHGLTLQYEPTMERHYCVL